MSRASERLQEALNFLAHRRAAMLRTAPSGKEAEYGSVFWYPSEPSYCWSSTYGDFSPQTLMAGVARGLIDRKGSSHAYRITSAGLTLLANQEPTP